MGIIMTQIKEPANNPNLDNFYLNGVVIAERTKEMTNTINLYKENKVIDFKALSQETESKDYLIKVMKEIY